MTRRRVILGVMAVAFLGAMALIGGGAYGPLRPELWGAGVANNGLDPLCRPSFWLQRC